eukprot:gene634-biopygen5631
MQQLAGAVEAALGGGAEGGPHAVLERVAVKSATGLHNLAWRDGGKAKDASTAPSPRSPALYVLWAAASGLGYSNCMALRAVVHANPDKYGK